MKKKTIQTGAPLQPLPQPPPFALKNGKIFAPTPNISELIENIRSKDSAVRVPAQSALAAQYAEGSVSDKDVDALIAHMPGPSAKVACGSTKDELVSAMKKLLDYDDAAMDERYIPNSFEDVVYLEPMIDIRRHGRARFYSNGDFYPVETENGKFVAYLPDSYADYWSTACSAYMLGRLIAQHPKEARTETDMKMVSALVDAFRHILITGTNSAVEYVKDKSPKQKNEAYKLKARKQLAEALATADEIGYDVPKQGVLSIAHRLLED